MATNENSATSDSNAAPTSLATWMNAGAGWQPTLQSRAGQGEFRMADMLTIAGVDPETRGQ